MRLRWKVSIALIVAGVLAAAFLLRLDSSEQKAVEESQRLLQQQGFKTDLSEFNFSTSDELRARTAALTDASTFRMPRNAEEAARRSMLQQVMPELMQTVGSNAAIAAWKQGKWTVEANASAYLRSAGYSDNDLWPSLRELFNDDRDMLDAACAAALSGPIRFDLNASHGNAMLLPHLAALKNLAQTLGGRTMLELHDGNKDAAWTNVLASTRLVTAWIPEPAEVSHLVRFACATLAFNTIWQALQDDGWSDDRLAALQREWESADFFKGLPETAAFARASAAATCQLQRQQPLSFGMTFQEMLHSPRHAWSSFVYHREQLHYRHHGSYDDEKNLLLYYRDRELQLQNAVKSQNWSEMRNLPGVTNVIPFQSKHRSAMQAMLNMRQLTLSFQMYSSPGQGRSLPGRAADAESRRRLIVTAIALERYRGRQGGYPKTLQELVPDFLKNPPADFADGQPLRYRPTDDGHFVLYSVGLDCVDNGGTMPQSRLRRVDYQDGRPVRAVRETDVVWPRPASAADVEAFHREQLAALAEQENRQEEFQATDQWQRTARRRAQVEKIFATKPAAQPREPTFHGRRLSEVLQNESAIGTNKFALEDLLTLKQVITGAEPEIATFETPINYDVVTNLGELHLFIDAVADEDSDEGCNVGSLECKRATNGNCLLVWNTIYESPGKHALQMGLELSEPAKPDEGIFVGPPAPFVVSNLCQFSLSSAFFNPELGATLHAKLPEPYGAYTIELTSPTGALLKTISGSTSNGVIKVHWDLTDDHGKRCTNQAFGSVFHITLPSSGRSQTQKGP